MDDKLNISKPEQGVNTLVSELSLLRLERTIKKLEEMRSNGMSEKDIRDYIDSHHKDFDDRSKKQIYRLSLGLTPKDDFSEQDVDNRKLVNETTLEISFLKPSEEFGECSLAFFEGQRWAVVSRKGRTLVLKRF